jgi:hypothetical protein
MEITTFKARRAHVSATNAIGPALNYMMAILFKPFNFIRWFKFGLVGFLVALGSGGGIGNYFNIPSNSKDLKALNLPHIDQIMEWLTTHLTLIIIIAIAAVLVISLIWMVVIYFSSRFTFVYLDGVIKNDIEIKRTYRENKTAGWSYFLWRTIFGPTALLAITLVIALPILGLIFWAKAKADAMHQSIWSGFTVTIIILLVLMGMLLILLLIIWAIISWLTGEFTVPIMYLLKIKILDAWRVLWSLIKNNKTDFFIYMLIRMVLGLAAGMLTLLPCCGLACFAIAPTLLIVGLVALALKYPLVWLAVVMMGIPIIILLSILWHTLITPITVFFKTYSLIFMQGFGPEFASITPPKPPTQEIATSAS